MVLGGESGKASREMFPCRVTFDDGGPVCTRPNCLARSLLLLPSDCFAGLEFAKSIARSILEFHAEVNPPRIDPPLTSSCRLPARFLVAKIRPCSLPSSRSFWKKSLTTVISVQHIHSTRALQAVRASADSERRTPFDAALTRFANSTTPTIKASWESVMIFKSRRILRTESNGV